MKSYIINLLRSSDRRSYMIAQLQQLQLPFEIIEAVDGELLSNKDIDAAAIEKKGEIACTMSHTKALKRFLESEDEFALIIEDDSKIIEPDMLGWFEKLKSGIRPDNITLLTYHWHRPGVMELMSKFSNGMYGIYNVKELWGVCRSGAYFIGREAAQNIVRFHENGVQTTADNWLVYKREKLIHDLEVIYPQMITEAPQFGSDIQYITGGWQLVAKNFFKWCLNNNVPVFSNFILKRRIRKASEKKKIIVVS